jgi:hypothetical protein
MKVRLSTTYSGPAGGHTMSPPGRPARRPAPSRPGVRDVAPGSEPERRRSLADFQFRVRARAECQSGPGLQFQLTARGAIVRVLLEFKLYLRRVYFLERYARQMEKVQSLRHMLGEDGYVLDL